MSDSKEDDSCQEKSAPTPLPQGIPGARRSHPKIKMKRDERSNIAKFPVEGSFVPLCARLYGSTRCSN